MIVERTLDVVTDHFQLLIGDSVQAPLLDTTALWDSPGRVASLKGSPELVGLGTVRYGGKTRVTLRVGDHLDESLRGWSLLGEFFLSVPSGELILWGPELENIHLASKVSVPKDGYQGAAFVRGAVLVTDEMSPDGSDEYLVTLQSAGTNFIPA